VRLARKRELLATHDRELTALDKQATEINKALDASKARVMAAEVALREALTASAALGARINSVTRRHQSGVAADRCLDVRTGELVLVRDQKHRCTIYRWIRAGTFPPKRAGGGRGWLRSDVERWLNTGSLACE
jgi:predicted DNA-binding transcriptional regulator AlpA